MVNSVNNTTQQAFINPYQQQNANTPDQIQRRNPQEQQQTQQSTENNAANRTNNVSVSAETSSSQDVKVASSDNTEQQSGRANRGSLIDITV